MIFYKAKAEDGHMVIAGTQADARAVNKDFTQIDIPTDKAGLMAYVQGIWDEYALPVSHSEEAPQISDNDLDAKAYRLALSKAVEMGFDNVLDALENPPSLPQPDPHVKASIDFSAETRRQISVEEEIQNCDLPRLATYASNVAWRYKELSEKC